MKVGVIMRKKYGRLLKKENIIVFPGTYEKLIREGFLFVENGAYEQAVRVFDQAIDLGPESVEFYAPYALALYETKDYQRAKEMTIRLLHSGPEDYIGTMELYLTILIQLEEYDDVDMNIDILLEEGFVPEELINKFTYLRELNNRMSTRYGKEDAPAPEVPFTLDDFIDMDPFSQQQMLASLNGTDLRMMTSILEDIAEGVNFSPLVITFALSLLAQSGHAKELTVRKFDMEKKVIPIDMPLPGEDALSKKVLSIIEELLEQDPTRFELAKGMVEKFEITAFPFKWGNYTAEEVANAYVLYIDTLFSGEAFPITPLHEFIKYMDSEVDF